jgi:hypothetical protein
MGEYEQSLPVVEMSWLLRRTAPNFTSQKRTNRAPLVLTRSGLRPRASSRRKEFQSRFWCGYCRSKSATLWWIRMGSRAVMNSRSSGKQMIARPVRRRRSAARRELRAQLRGHRFSRRSKSSLDWNWSHKKSPWKFSLSIMSSNRWKIKRFQPDFFLRGD